jgi:hypothetical protein
MSIIKSIEKNHFGALKKHKSWDFTYWYCDIHSSIIIPNYSGDTIPKEFYPYAKEVLQMLSKRSDIVLALYTCSHPHEQEEYLNYFKEHGIIFKYVNKNPEVKTNHNGYGFYEEKPYFNILIEDKSGFDAEVDWEEIGNYFKYKDSKFLTFLYKIKRLFKNGI